MRPHLLAALFAVAFSLPAAAQVVETTEVPVISDRRESFGAVMMPPALPRGATAAYGFVGAQEIGGGYRQGIAFVELEGRARMNYFHLSFGADVVGKYRLLTKDRLEVAPSLALGLGFNTGSKWIDVRNFRSFDLRLEPAITAAYRIHDTLRGFALAQVPLAFGLAPAGGSHVAPKVGGGVEFYLGDDLSVMAMGAIGPDWMREPNGFTLLQVGYSVRLGFGFRLF